MAAITKQWLKLPVHRRRLHSRTQVKIEIGPPKNAGSKYVAMVRMERGDSQYHELCLEQADIATLLQELAPLLDDGDCIAVIEKLLVARKRRKTKWK